MSITTNYDHPDLGIHLRMVDGYLDLVHLPQTNDPRALRTTLQAALSELLSSHQNQLLSQIPVSQEIRSQAQMDVMREIDHVLDEASAFATYRFGDDFPYRADGRDSTGEVHVSLTLSEVLLLDVPDSVLDEPATAGLAVKEATNLALTRLASDFEAWIDALPAPAAAPSSQQDWEQLRLQFQRLKQGYF